MHVDAKVFCTTETSWARELLDIADKLKTYILDILIFIYY